MLGAQEQPKAWGEAPDAEHSAPTLATAPEGLSARRVERWLDLPPGAWQRRRLYALRLAGQAYSHLGFRVGDLVVVEPGAKEQPGSIVVTRSPRGPSLRRIPPSMHGSDRRMPTVLELPLKERVLHRGEHVVGTVIGLLRNTGTGALRPVPLASPRPNQKRRPALRPVEDQPLPAQSPVEVPLEQLRRIEGEWRRWVAKARLAEEVEAPAVERDRWDRLDASLVTLCDCLTRTHVPEIRRALLEEAQGLVRSIRREMDDRSRG
jgi:hypothetical protein